MNVTRGISRGKEDEDVEKCATRRKEKGRKTEGRREEANILLLHSEQVKNHS
jgi:hypothetical protein